MSRVATLLLPVHYDNEYITDAPEAIRVDVSENDIDGLRQLSSVVKAHNLYEVRRFDFSPDMLDVDDDLDCDADLTEENVSASTLSSSYSLLVVSADGFKFTGALDASNSVWVSDSLKFDDVEFA